MTECCNTPKKELADPAVVLDLLRDIRPVETETVARADSHGRVLAQDIATDRPSPPLDVSAMDGYALKLADLPENMTLPVSGEAAIGHPPAQLPAGHAMQIFTGAPVPFGADTVIQCEWTDKSGGLITLKRIPAPGDHIRVAGENAYGGERVTKSGHIITPQIASSLAAFGVAEVTCHKPIRLCLVTTGNELRAPEDNVDPWEIRDSNSATLQALFEHLPWIGDIRIVRCPDDPKATQEVLQDALGHADALLTTGGVSMGDHDYVPGALETIGARILFHKLAIRPGKPLLGAISADGKPIFGLPGNPVSVAVTARRFAAPALRRRAGATEVVDRLQIVQVQGGPSGWKTLPLWCHRPARITSMGHVEIVQLKGSGDLVSFAQSDGFVITPPNVPAAGKLPFMSWTL